MQLQIATSFHIVLNIRLGKKKSSSGGEAHPIKAPKSNRKVTDLSPTLGISLYCVWERHLIKALVRNRKVVDSRFGS